MSFTPISIMLAYLLTFLLIIGYYPYIFSKSYRHAKAIPTFLLITGGLLTIMAYAWIGLESDKNDGFLSTIFLLSFFTLGGLVFYGVYQYYVKGYGRRASGARRRPFRFKYVILIGAITFVIMMLGNIWYFDMDRSYIWRVILAGFGISTFMGYDERFESQFDEDGNELSIDTVIEEPTVLYIRSFKAERAPFWCGNYLKSPIMPPAGNTAIVLSFPFMDFFGEAFEANFAPLVGLGNPVDTIPSAGITISYEKDGNWQESLLRHLEHCEAVIMTIGHSTNLSWELEKIKSLGMTNKFFLFTSPKMKRSTLRWHLLFQGLRKAIPDWETFRQQLQSMGFELPAGSPPEGAIFGFDQQGKAQLIAEQLWEPESYVNTLKDYLSNTPSP